MHIYKGIYIYRYIKHISIDIYIHIHTLEADLGLILQLGRPAGEGNGYPLQ